MNACPYTSGQFMARGLTELLLGEMIHGQLISFASKGYFTTKISRNERSTFLNLKPWVMMNSHPRFAQHLAIYPGC